MIYLLIFLIVAVVVLSIVAWIKFRRIKTVVAGTSTNSTEGIGEATEVIGLWTCVFGLLGLCAIAIWSFARAEEAAPKTFWAVFGTDVMLGLASAAIGALLGFIFGIPRTLDPASRAAVAAAADKAGSAASSQAALAANTNLERISDWLTTLLIGATLVQSEKVIAWIGSLGEKFKSGPDALTNEALVPVIVVYFFALAFLSIYLVTRLYLTFALQQTLALLTGVAPVVPRILPITLPDGTAGAAYPETTIQASGGTSPLRWSVTPALPNGLSLDASGKITGTPTVTAARADYTFSLLDGATPPASASTRLSLEIR